MKKIVSLILLIASLVDAQIVIRQDDVDNYHKQPLHVMVSTSDGYSAVTGLTPTCTIRRPGATSFVSCTGSVSEIGTGVYRGTLDAVDWENQGTGMMILTGAGAQPSRLPYQVLPASWPSKNNLLDMGNDIGNTARWTLGAATRTANTTADYQGYTIADTLTADGTTAQHRAFVSSVLSTQGSNYFYGSVEVRSGTANNAWVGDDNYAVGLDINTSTGAVSPAVSTNLKGWKSERIDANWYRVHFIYQISTTSTTNRRYTLAIGNGTVSTAPPSFSSSGTMIFARAVLSRLEDVDSKLIDQVAHNLQSASSASSVTLAPNESATNSVMLNREICFWNQTNFDEKACSCIDTYNGTTKVATLHESLFTTLSSGYKYKIGGYCSRRTSPVSGSITNASFATNAIDANAFAQGAADEVWSSATRSITDKNNFTLADGSFSAVKIATDAANRLADTTLRRDPANVEGSAYGDTLDFNSLYGVTQMQTGKVNIIGGELRVFRSNNTDLLSTRNVTTSSAAAPITGVNP